MRILLTSHTRTQRARIKVRACSPFFSSLIRSRPRSFRSNRSNPDNLTQPMPLLFNRAPWWRIVFSRNTITRMATVHLSPSLTQAGSLHWQTKAEQSLGPKLRPAREPWNFYQEKFNLLIDFPLNIKLLLHSIMLNSTITLFLIVDLEHN